MAMQTASYLKMLHPLRGEGRLHLGSRSERLDPKSVWLIPSGIAHAISDSPSAAQVFTVVCVRQTVIPESLKSELHWDRPVICRRPGVLVEYRRILRALFAEQSLPSPSGVALVTRALDLLRLFQQSPHALSSSEKGRARARVATWLRSVGGMQVASIDQAAEQVSLSRRSFTAAVRAVTGKSWLQWHREQRIRHARGLLENTTRSVTSIAFECGYEDLSSFYRNFKRLLGTSPEAWRHGHGRT